MKVALINVRFVFLQALKMPYFSNKPVPTPGHLLPRPKISAPAATKKAEETSLKRKMFDSLPDAGDIYI